jgi:hypothetical protein
MGYGKGTDLISLHERHSVTRCVKDGRVSVYAGRVTR